ncbi:hypothetical protein DsansV1_C05g0057421 [Dioscorea sansibarensis]
MASLFHIYPYQNLKNTNKEICKLHVYTFKTQILKHMFIRCACNRKKIFTLLISRRLKCTIRSYHVTYKTAAECTISVE